MKKTKLKLSRQTVRVLSGTSLAEVQGGYRDKPTATCASCVNTICCVSFFESCGNTDCCLEPL